MSIRFSIGILLGLSIATISFGEPTTSTEQIKKAWQLRQNKVKSVRFEWTAKWYYPAGGLTHTETMMEGMRSMRQQREPSKIAAIPPSDTEFTLPGKLIISGEKVRYEYTAPQWSPKTASFEPTPYCAVFDGQKETSMHTLSGSAKHSEAMKKSSTKHGDIFDPPLRPITMALFGNNPRMQPYPIEKLSVFRSFTREGARHLELKMNKASGKSEILFLLDETHLLPKKMTHMVNGSVHLDIESTFSPNPQCDWIPSSWVIRRCNPDGSLEVSIEYIVTAVEINATIQPEVFQLEIPVGSVVADADKKQFSLIQGDGQPRVLSQAEISSSYEEINPLASDSSDRTLLIFALVVLIGLAFLNRHRIRRVIGF